MPCTQSIACKMGCVPAQVEEEWLAHEAGMVALFAFAACSRTWQRFGPGLVKCPICET